MILINNDTLLTQFDITNCQAEETDHKSIRHVIKFLKDHYQIIFVYTSDTDVLLLLLPLIKQIPLMYTPNIYCRFVIGNVVRFYNINVLCLEYREETCKSLPFFTLSPDVTQYHLFSITARYISGIVG